MIFEGPAPFTGSRSGGRVDGDVIRGGAGVGWSLADGGLVVTDGDVLDRGIIGRSPAVVCILTLLGNIVPDVKLKLRKPDGTERRMPHPVTDLLNKRPNEFQTGREFASLFTREAVLTGEIILRVWRGPGGMPERLSVLPAHRVNVDMTGPTDWAGLPLGTGVKYWTNDGTFEPFAYNPDMPQVVHVRQNPDPDCQLRGRPLCWGMPDVLAASIYGSVYHREGFRQGGPPRLALTPIDAEGGGGGMNTDNEAAQVLNVITQAVKSTQSWRTTAKIPDGYKLDDLGWSGRDPAMIEMARFADEKICAAYGLPVVVAGNMERSTYSNVRSQVSGIIKNAVRPILDLLAAGVQRALIDPMGGRYAEWEAFYDTEELARDELRVWNTVVLSRYQAGLISQDKALMELGYDPADKGPGLQRKPMKGDPAESDPGMDPKGVSK